MIALTERLRLNAARAPHAEALVHRAERVSYGTLWQQVRAIGAFLHRHGVTPGTRVALLLKNSVRYVEAYYGVLAAGAVAVPLNTDARAADLVRWLAHCGAAWLFLDVRHPEAEAVCAYGRGRLRTVAHGNDAGAERWPLPSELGSGYDAAPARGPDDLATILYTSGTTGRPKGVMLSHGNLAANVESILAYLDLGPNDRIVTVLPFYYSYGASVLHTHLAAGGCVVLEDGLVYPHAIVERMVAERATGLSGVGATFALLLNRVRLVDYDLGVLRYVTQAGGPMPLGLVQRMRAVLPRARFYLMYGQTEATARLSYLPPERLAEKPGSVGIPVAGVAIEVRDDRGAPAAAFETGEIWARGPNIMLGYWDDPAATRAALVDGWLKTGDLGYRDAEGFLYVQGRKTDMIKSGAHRIDPREVEDAIAALDGVADVAVVGVADEILGQVIKAVIVPRAGAALNPMQIRAYCQRRLASYKTPRFVEFVSQLPRTASGKVQRFSLVSDHP